MKLSDYVIDVLVEQGIKHVFMLPGGGAMHLNDSLGKRQTEIEHVINLHEQASAIAAEAYARVTNNLGVALVSTGPAATNAVTGVAAAWFDSTPCLFLSGQVKSADLKGSYGVRQLGPQEIDIVEIVKSITKYAVTVTDPLTIRYHLEKALYLAKEGRPGPVWLELPLDIQAATIEVDKLESFRANKQKIPSKDFLIKQVNQVVEALIRSKRPVLLMGNGVRTSGAALMVEEVVKALGIPVLTTWLGQDLLADNNTLLMGRPGPLALRTANFILQNADLILSVGARLDRAFLGFAPENFAREARCIMVDIDEAEINKLGKKIDLPIVADAKYFLEHLLACRERFQKIEIADWLRQCNDWKVKYSSFFEERSKKDLVSTYELCDKLSEFLPEKEIIVLTSGGASIGVFFMGFKAKKGQRIFHNRGTGSMGLAIPASIGACLAGGRCPTTCIESDGSLQMNAQELQTISRMNLPIKIIILNNQGYASIRNSQLRHFGHLIGADATSDLTFPDSLKLADTYGISGVRISNISELDKTLCKVYQSPAPILCEIMIPPEELYVPSLSSVQTKTGGMVSKPLEDLWPFLSREEFYSNMMTSPLPEPNY